MRGIAALVVLFHHSLLTIPVLAAVYENDAVPVEDVASVAWMLVHTPLHNLWEGKGAVYIFFVLSGVVLTLPVLRG
ncbi:hypothetical protein [Arthrobacter sp. OY3WO11]|uniref:hypothetical protein n=1 Tax=Arthrobacter sp. OY3WO11 TaxID=1835723 RepID=UPI0012E730B8|nr:hypothetical protein [Arthrobacter sp. OY3WO11]